MSDGLTIEVTMPAREGKRKYKLDVVVKPEMFGKDSEDAAAMSRRLSEVIDRAFADVQDDVLPPRRPMVALAMFILHNQKYFGDDVYAQYKGTASEEPAKGDDEEASEEAEEASEEEDDGAAVETVWSTLTDPDFAPDDDLDKIVEYLGDLTDEELGEVDDALSIILDWLKMGPAKAKASEEAQDNLWLYQSFVEGMKDVPVASRKNLPEWINEISSSIQHALDEDDDPKAEAESEGEAW